MNIKDAYIHNGEAILKDIKVENSVLKKILAGKKADDAYLDWETVCDLTGIKPKTAGTADKVGHKLTFSGGVTGTWDGSADKTVTIPTKSSWNYDDVYLKLTGNGTTNPLTGTIYIKDVNGIILNSKDKDLNIWEVYGNSGVWASQYGFNLQYLGTGSGNNNDLVLWAHNQGGTHIETYRVKQDGTFIFKATPKVGTNVMYHAGNLTASVIGGLGTLSNNISGNAATATNANYLLGCTNTITVAGDSNTYYPVMVSTTTNKKFSNIITVWKDLGSKTASYPENHSNGSSSMLYRYDVRNCYWDGNGGYCTTLDARYMYARLVSETMMLSNGVGNFCIWLRGGGTEYKISTSWNISSSDITIYYSSTNVGSSTYPVTIAPRTDIGNGGIYNTISIPCNVNYAATANWATSAGFATYVLDVNGSSATTFAYSKSGLNYGDYTWLAGWNGYELRAVNKSQFAQANHTHTKSQITDFPTSLPANGGYAYGIESNGILDSQEKIDNFITPSRLEYILFKTSDANNVDFASNDGMLLSIPWNSTAYGVQLAFDDTLTGTIKVRGKSNSWGNWYTLLHSGNYTSYTVKKDGTGASGTWGISITGNAKTATTSTYASNVGSAGTAGTNYVTAANVISMYNWYNSITATDEASNTAIDKWNEIVSFLAGIADTSTLSGILAGYAAAGHDHDGRYIKWGGSAADTNAMAWGTLTAANGYTILSHAASSDGGDWGMVNKGGKIYMQLDGYYYQNEGQYRVTDVSETVTALGTNGNYLTWTKNGATNNITIPYATKADNADTVDGYHVSDNYNLLYKNVTNLTCTLSSITTDYWYVKILIQSSYQSIVNQKMYLIASYSNFMTKAELQVYGYFLGYKYTASSYNEDAITGIASTRQGASQVIWLRMKKPIQYEGITPNGNISIYSNYIASAEVVTSAPSGVIFTDTLQSDGQHILSGNIKAASFQKNGSDDNYVLLGGGGHKLVSDFSMAHNHPYLPLSGGALTSSSLTNILDLNGSAGIEVGIRFLRNGVPKGWIGYMDSGYMYMYNAQRANYLRYNDNGTLTFEGNTIWHAGNDGSGSSLDADLLDGKHATNFLAWSSMQNIGSSSPFQDAVNFFNNLDNLNNGGKLVYNHAGAEYTELFTRRNDSTAHGTILKWGYTDNYIRIIRMIFGKAQSTDWEKISAGYADTAGSVDWNNVSNKPTTISGYGITDALTTKSIIWKNDYERYVILLCKIGTNSTNEPHTINGTFWTTTGGVSRYQAAYINVHCSDWSSGHNEYYNFTPFGLGVNCRLVTCIYQSSKYLAITFENVQAINIYFDGSYDNILFTPVLYYVDNTNTINNSEIYNSISEVVYKKLDIYELPESTATYSLSNAAWTNTITLPTTAGSYILNIVSGNSTLTGVFSIGVSDNAKDEISLHLHGNGPRLYARTNGTTLQLSSNDASATSRSVTIKYRRMI